MLKKWFQGPVEQRLLLSFQNALDALMLFPADHVRSIDCLSTFLEILVKVQAKQQGKVTLQVKGNALLCGDTACPAREENFVLLLEQFKQCGIQCLVITDGVTTQEAIRFLSLMINTLPKEKGIAIGHQLQKAQIQHFIVCDDAGDKTQVLPKRQIWDCTRPLDVTVYSEACNTVKALSASIQQNKPVNGSSVRRAVSRLLEALKNDPEMVTAIVFRPQKANWVHAHMVRCSILAMRLGFALTREEGTIRLLGETGCLHDIGFLAIPEYIIYSENKLTPAERKIMMQHTILGAEILLTGSDFPPSAIEAALLHHADPLSRGYPDIPRKIKPSILCKIMRVVDAYESMIGGRPYRLPMSPLAAAQELIQQSGPFFDKAIVGAFLRTFGLFPAGSTVRLSDQSLGEVLHHNPDAPLHPEVRILVDPKGEAMSLSKTVNLAETDGLTILDAHTYQEAPSTRILV